MFLSERLYAEGTGFKNVFKDRLLLLTLIHILVKTDESLFLLATAYYRSGQKSHAYYTLKERCGTSPKCQLLFGRCAYELEK